MTKKIQINKDLKEFKFNNNKQRVRKKYNLIKNQFRKRKK
jgi:hypothetical protein